MKKTLIAIATVFLLLVLTSSIQAGPTDAKTDEEVKVMVDESIDWHNDEGNDDCVVLFSNKALYVTDRKDPVIEPMLKIENDCGKPITGNLGLFFQSKDKKVVEIQSLQQSLSQSIIVVKEYSYDCKELLSFNKDTNVATCYFMDFNGASTVFETVVKEVKDKTFFWDSKGIDYGFKDIQRNSALKVASTGKEGFELKESVGNVTVPEGISYLKFKAKLPKGSLHIHGYFIVTFENSDITGEKTILDPEWWETGEYTPDVNTVAMWHCNESSGTNVPDSTGDFDGTATNAAIWNTTTKKWGAGSCGTDATYWFSNDILWDGGFPITWTAEYWVYPLEVFDSSDAIDWQTWSKKNIQSPRNWFQGYFYNGTGAYSHSIRAGGFSFNFDSLKTSWAANTWFHLMTIADGATVAVYIDGVRDNGRAMNVPVAPGTGTDFYFGTNYGNPGVHLPNALFDEIVFSDINRFDLPFEFDETCICPSTGTWNIGDGSACTLTDVCNLADDFHISDGSLNVTSTGTLVIPTGNKAIVDMGENLFVEIGGKVITRS